MVTAAGLEIHDQPTLKVCSQRYLPVHADGRSVGKIAENADMYFMLVGNEAFTAALSKKDSVQD